MEQGERFYRFFIQGGSTARLEETVDRIAQQFNEQPYGFSYCPPGDGKKTPALLEIDNPRVIVSAIKKAEHADGYVLRLYEGSGQAADAKLVMFGGKFETEVHLNGFEIKTYLFIPEKGILTETDLIDA